MQCLQQMSYIAEKLSGRVSFVRVFLLLRECVIRKETIMIEHAQWITNPKLNADVVPVFRKKFNIEKQIEKAELTITALGVYEAFLNDKRVGQFILAPGWTSYKHRIQ